MEKLLCKKSLTILSFLSLPLFADQYVLVMSKDDNLCQHMGELYNKDLRKNGKVILKNHPEYNWLTWKQKVTFKKEHSEYDTDSPLSYQKELFDINNDGKDETVLFRRTYATNRLEYKADDLSYVKDGYQINYDDDTLLKLNTENKLINLYADIGYHLSLLPDQSAFQTSFLIRPFKYQKHFYLSFFANIGLNTPYDYTWQEDVKNDINAKNSIVVTKYDSNNTLQDVCYFIRPQPVTTYKGDKK